MVLTVQGLPSSGLGESHPLPPGRCWTHFFCGGGRSGGLCWIFVAVRELSLAAVHRLLIAVVSLVEHRLEGTKLQELRLQDFHRLNNCGAWA